MDIKQDTTPLQLPQELIDNIIDHLHDSPRDLKACSLVSHSFHPRSHFNLFQRVDVRSIEAAQRFFTHLSPETRAIIRTLMLCGPNSSPFTHFPEIPMMLQSLHLDRLVLGEIDLRLLKPFSSGLSITYLETQYCRFTSFSELRSMLWSLPSLTTLIVFFPSFGDHSAPVDRDNDSPSHASLLSDLTTTISALLSPLYLTNLKELRRLNISLSSGEDVQRLAGIIQALHSSLRHLSIEMSSDPADDAMLTTPESIVLGPLQTFTMKFYGESNWSVVQWVLAWGMDILEVNASNLAESLHTITFRYCLYGLTATNVVLASVQAWKVLDALADLFPTVETVHIAFECRGTLTTGILANLSSVDNMIDTVTKVLPKLAARGVLVVDACEFESWESEACMTEI
ncbi:hypothetical protein BDZ89DRAFT_1064939 [Hymenopellis radicata]|nr:hypothetical protein BDZ89DRAFT_1064939 [Hymenopellis radicata]